MPIITINSRVLDVAAGTTVLRAALDNGIYIPHFCWHPLLSISGNCRMCVVEIEGRNKLEVSCNLPVADGMVIRTDTPAVKAMRSSVLEFLLINHPLDCPICDQAGECLLQDFHFKYSGRGSRFKDGKVRKPKVVDIGDNVKLDDERCVLCTRCVRFCHEVVKAPELTVATRGDRSFITTAPGKKFNNPYSLNTVDICPVGALTSKDFRFKKRVWMLSSSPSICPFCSNGCPIWVDHEDGRVYRLRPRDDEAHPSSVRGVAKSQISGRTFLCDEGRLSYKEWQTETRITSPLLRGENGFRECSVERAVSSISSAVKGISPDDIVGILSAQCSCEEMDSFMELMKVVVGTKKIFRSSRTVAGPSEDGILRRKDKNPNSMYLELFGLGNIPSDAEGKVLFITDSLSDDEIMRLVNFKWELIVQFTHDSKTIMPGAGIVLPRATLPEMDGSFMRYDGKKQFFHRAFKPKGESRDVAQWLKLLRF